MRCFLLMDQLLEAAKRSKVKSLFTPCTLFQNPNFQVKIIFTNLMVNLGYMGHFKTPLLVCNFCINDSFLRYKHPMLITTKNSMLKFILKLVLIFENSFLLWKKKTKRLKTVFRELLFVKFRLEHVWIIYTVKLLLYSLKSQIILLK